MPMIPSEVEVLFRQLNQCHRNAMQEAQAHADLSEVGHPMLLMRCAWGERHKDHCYAQRELAEHLHISPPAVANSIKSLERGGYVRREPGKDARSNRVILTEKGHGAVLGCLESFNHVTAQMLQDFSPQEEAQLIAFFRRMIYNLSPTTQPPDQ